MNSLLDILLHQQMLNFFIPYNIFESVISLDFDTEMLKDMIPELYEHYGEKYLSVDLEVNENSFVHWLAPTELGDGET